MYLFQVLKFKKIFISDSSFTTADKYKKNESLAELEDQYLQKE